MMHEIKLANLLQQFKENGFHSGYELLIPVCHPKLGPKHVSMHTFFLITILETLVSSQSVMTNKVFLMVKTQKHKKVSSTVLI